MGIICRLLSLRKKCVGAKERAGARPELANVSTEAGASQCELWCGGKGRSNGEREAIEPSARRTAEGGCPHMNFPEYFSSDELFAWEDDFGVEEGAGDAGGDGEQFGLAGEDFDLAGAGEFGEVDGASAADAGGGGLVGGDGGKVRQELAGVDEESF